MKRRRDRTELLLREPNLYKVFLILALPVFGANFMKAFNELVDTYFIGQIANSVAAQAGVSLSWPLLNIFASFQAGFGVAGVAVVSQLLGAGRRERARDNAGVLLLVSVVLGAVLNLLLYLAAPGVMVLMGASGDVLACSVSYLRVRSFELTFTFIFAAFQAIRQAQGDTVTPVVLSVSAVMLNIVLTAVNVRVLGLGVFGAGLATAAGNAVIVPVCLYLLFDRRQALFLNRRHLRLQWPLFRRLTAVAAPAAASQALSSLGFLVLQAVILSYGDHVTAAFSIGNKVSNLLLMPVLAMGSVLAAYVGQNIGAGNGERARRAYDLIWGLNQGLISDPAGMGPKTIPETRSGRALANPMIYLNITSVLRRVDPEQEALYNERAAECVNEIFQYHYKPELGCTLESVAMDGTPRLDVTEGRVVNPGHDIECSWFLMEDANRKGDKKQHETAVKIFDQAINAGWDYEYGGLLYFIDCLGRPPEAYEHDMKLWWPHDEILIASLMIFRDTGDEQYLTWFERTLDYCKEHFSDPEFGDWYGYLRRDGKPTMPACKGSTFKGPFHLPRMLIMCDQMLDQLLAKQ